jgi:hypothetical protein
MNRRYTQMNADKTNGFVNPRLSAVHLHFFSAFSASLRWIFFLGERPQIIGLIPPIASNRQSPG